MERRLRAGYRWAPVTAKWITKKSRGGPKLTPEIRAALAVVRGWLEDARASGRGLVTFYE